MSPEDQQKFEKAYRAWMEKNPYADKPGGNGDGYELLTPRQIMEIGLKSGSIFEAWDEFLLAKPDQNLDDVLKDLFGETPKENPPPPARKPPRPQRHFRI